MEKQFVALYVYETSHVELAARSSIMLYRLAFVDRKFRTDPVGLFQEQSFELAPGVYGWSDTDPVAIVVSGKAIAVTMRRSSKDPWPPPPPPPPPADLAQHPEAVQLWALHWVGREGEYFMSTLG